MSDPVARCPQHGEYSLHTRCFKCQDLPVVDNPANLRPPLRPQQVHVPMRHRIALELRRRLAGLKDRILHPTVLMQRDRRPRWIDGRDA